jgi:uncharacterized DUF497 family protein
MELHINMYFEWDENKRQSNLEKHGIDFMDAAKVMAEAVFILEDTRRDYGEPRFQAFGELSGVVIIVAFTIRQGTRRIISARRANLKERKRYERILSEGE